MNTSKTRNLYYVMDEKEEMFVKGNLNNHENSYTGEIDRAFRTYSKEEAIHISNECNDIGMNTKVVMFTWRCTLVARNVKGIENNSGIKGDRKLSELNAGETFKDGNGIEYIVCQQFENGTAAVVRKGLFDHRLYFGDTNDWRDSNIREYLNKEYFKELAAQFGEDNIVEFTRDLISLDGYDDYGKCRDKVSIILDASKYGIPQARERLYVVSLLSGNEFEFPDEIPLKFHLRDFLDKTVNPADYQLSDAEKQLFFTNNGKLYVKEATKIGYKLVEDGDCINVAFPNSKTRRGRVGKGVAKTLTTAPRQAVYVNGCLRMLTAKEYWRLMGFKDRDYAAMKRVGLTEAQICHLAGNSICVPVLQQIFTKLITMGEIER